MYRSPNIFRVLKYRKSRSAGNVPRIKEARSTFKILTGKRIGNRSLGRARYRWEDNISKYFKEIVVNTRN